MITKKITIELSIISNDESIKTGRQLVNEIKEVLPIIETDAIRNCLGMYGGVKVVNAKVLNK